jgi:hypothetical protein
MARREGTDFGTTFAVQTANAKKRKRIAAA